MDGSAVSSRLLARGPMVLTAAIGVTAAAAVASAAEAPAPNIVLVYADDMGLGDTSAYQDLTGVADAYQIRTPNMERLAALGTRFTDAHSPAAVCTPSRISMLTGTYSFRGPLKQRAALEFQHQQGTFFPGERRTLAHLAGRAGYQVYGYGKWHLASQGDRGGSGLMDEGPRESGFDRWTGTPGNFANGKAMIVDEAYCSFDAWEDLVPLNDPAALPWPQLINPNRMPVNGALGVLPLVQPTILDAALNDLSSHMAGSGDEPFLVYYASHSNHVPWIAPTELAGEPITRDITVAGGPIAVQTRPDEDGDGIPEEDDPLYGSGNFFNNTYWVDYWQDDGSGNVVTNGPTERGRMVVENDVILGELIDFLEQTPDPRNPGHELIDNTLIIFTSDNGAGIQSEVHPGALPLPSDPSVTADIRGDKATPFEGGTRVPTIVAWPGRVPAGATSDALFSQTDFYATFADAMGQDLAPNEAVDSESVLGAWVNGLGGVVRRTDIVLKYREFMSLRRGNLRLRARDGDYADSGDRFGDNLDFDDLVVDGFHDLDTDLPEQTDLSGDAEQPVAEMLAALQAIVDQGYSRPGAQPVADSVNFRGGAFHTDANWFSYTPALSGERPWDLPSGPGGPVIGFVFVDGEVSFVVPDAAIIQRNGTVTFLENDTRQSRLEGGRWLVEGGTLRSADGTFNIEGGAAVVVDGGSFVTEPDDNIRLTNGDGTIVVRRGVMETGRLLFARFPTPTAGAKVVEVAGEGVITLREPSEPVRFGDDGDAGNDYLSFAGGSAGRVVTGVGAQEWASLYASGRLRVDGLTGADLGLSFAEAFSVAPDGNGGEALTVIAAPRTCEANVNADAALDQADVSDFAALLALADPMAEFDGCIGLDAFDAFAFLGLFAMGCAPGTL